MSGVHTPPQTPLLFRDRSRGTLGQTPAVQGEMSDGEMGWWFKYTEGISKVQFCTCMRRKLRLFKEIKNLSDELSSPQQSFLVFLLLLRTELPPMAGSGGISL